MAKIRQHTHRLTGGFRVVICCVLLVCVVAFVALTLHWHLVNDPAQIDYACFLMDHGMAPYKDLIEMNMPGIYMVNWSVMHTLGGGALAWRFFDLLVTGLAGLAMVWIALPYDWLAGVFGGTLFALYHGRDGPAQAGQRDLIIAMLLLWAVAFLFESFRRDKISLLFFCALFGAAATTIKPLALPFLLLLIVAACIRFRRLGRPISKALIWSVAGTAIPVAGVCRFLSEEGSLQAFSYVVRRMLPFYARLGRASFSFVLDSSFTPSVITIVLLASLIVVVSRSSLSSTSSEEERWEQVILLAGIGFGLFSYFGQGTGFPYHRYPMLAFIMLWTSIQFWRGTRQQGLVRVTAFVGILFGVTLAPVYTARAARSTWDEAYNVSLAADLNALGGEKLSGRVLCLSTMADCDTTLYRLKLVQDTGLFYDYFIFGDGNNPVIARTRQRILPQLLKNPPRAIILSRRLYPQPDDGYSKLETWPEFERYIAAHYTLYDDREFSKAECGVRGYRLYVLSDGGDTNSAATGSHRVVETPAAKVEGLC